MCPEHKKSKVSLQLWVLIALLAGIACYFFPLPGQVATAEIIMKGFTSILKLISLPIIFLALVTSFTGIEKLDEFKKMSMQVIRWTLITTIIAASTALLLFLIVSPATIPPEFKGKTLLAGNFLDHIIKVIPSNPFQPFLEGNVIGVLLLALGIGFGLLQVQGREKVHEVLSPLLAALMRLVKIVISLIPLTVWAGIILSFDHFQDVAMLKKLSLYLAVVIGANLFQAFVSLPLILKAHGIAPFRTMRLFMPALTMAFFSKSSVATLPLAMTTAEENLKVPSKIARFVLPVCTTINMNGCAAFILATTLFVATSHGITFSPFELGLFVVLATVAAVGNAGIPMGCFFLSSAILAAMNLPLDLMGLILPFYAFIDMLETAVNVWSDASVALIVTKSQSTAKPLEVPLAS
ncbi:MAG: dicarboxylate/amino acid:cation symporter [Chlamydiota bacterium]